MASKKFLRISLLIAWLFLTIFLSLQAGDESSKLSNWLAVRVINFFGLNVARIDIFHAVLRDVAHFMVHLILAGLMYGALILFLKRKQAMISCFVICFMIALFDEVMQGQVSGRACELSDLLLNLFGVETGLLIGILMSSEV